MSARQRLFCESHRTPQNLDVGSVGARAASGVTTAERSVLIVRSRGTSAPVVASTALMLRFPSRPARRMAALGSAARGPAAPGVLGGRSGVRGGSSSIARALGPARGDGAVSQFKFQSVAIFHSRGA